MGRPRKWASDAERMAARRSAEPRVSEHVNEQPARINEHDGVITDGAATVHGQRVPATVFAGTGRGVVRRHNGTDYVQVAWHDGSTRVVTADTWRAHLSHACPAGRGWQCRDHAP